MMADDRYRAALDAAMEDVNAAIAQVAEAKKFANTIAEKAGVEPPYADIEVPGISKVSLAIRADQFANYPSPSAAARAVLEWRGQAKGSASLDAIYDALVAGGFSFTATKNDPKGGLKVALGKDVLVVRLSNGTYGLREWYPNLRKSSGRSRDTGDTEDPALFDREATPEPPPAASDEEAKEDKEDTAAQG